MRRIRWVSFVCSSFAGEASKSLFRQRAHLGGSGVWPQQLSSLAAQHSIGDLMAIDQSAQHLRTAVIGVGYLGRFHAQKYAQLEGSQLLAVADANSEAALKVAAELGV